MLDNDTLLEVLLFYLGWGWIWTSYSLLSTVLHPFFDKMKVAESPIRLIVYYYTTWIGWPYFMVAALVNMDKEAKKYNDTERTDELHK